MSEKPKKDGWDKFQILVNCFAVIVIAGIGGCVDSTLKNREVSAKYVEIAVNILRVKPEDSSKNLREWAINVVNKYSIIQLSPDALAELRTNSLPAGNFLLDANGNIIQDVGGSPIKTN
jgi:hypothetical protein